MALGFSTVSPAFANANAESIDVDSINVDSINIESSELSEQDVQDAKTIKKYLEISNDGTYQFDSDAAKEAGVREALISRTVQDFNNINEELRKDNLAVSTMADECPGLSHYGSGTNGDKYIGLDYCDSKDVIYLLSISAAIATIAAAIAAAVSVPAAVASGVAAGIFAIGAATVSYYNNGRGIAIFYDGDLERVTGIGSQ